MKWIIAKDYWIKYIEEVVDFAISIVLSGQYDVVYLIYQYTKSHRKVKGYSVQRLPAVSIVSYCINCFLMIILKTVGMSKVQKH